MAKKKTTKKKVVSKPTKKKTPKKIGSKANKLKHPTVSKTKIKPKAGRPPKKELIAETRKKRLDALAPIPKHIQKQIKKASRKVVKGDLNPNGGFAKGNKCGNRFTSATAKGCAKRAQTARKPITNMLKYWLQYPANTLKFTKDIIEAHSLKDALPPEDFENLTVGDVVALVQLGLMAGGDSSIMKEVMNRVEGKQVDRLEAMINKDKLSVSEGLALLAKKRLGEKRAGK